MTKTVGKRIRESRMLCGMTQAQLASMVHVTRASVQSWESGQTYPSIDNCVVLAKIFHVSTDYLLARTSSKVLYLDEYAENERALIYDMLAFFDRRHEQAKRENRFKRPGTK